MIEPDFGEFQLQQLFNNELARKLPAFGIQPIIPTQPEEKDLGWDTGFYIPGLKTPDPLQKNCNLFLQYKLSKIVIGSQGGQWRYWRRPYFRFRIAMWKNTGHPGGNYPDFHQYEALKRLADNGYPTFYVTNSTVDLGELIAWANSKVLTDHNPTLDIRNISDRHIVATFTDDSNHFFLDSNPEKLPKMQIPSKVLKETLTQGVRTSLREDLDIVPKLLSEHDIFISTFEARRRETKLDRIETEWLLLYNTLIQTLGLVWWKLQV